MKKEYNFHKLKKQNFSIIHSPLQTLKNITFYQKYNNLHKNKRIKKIDTMTNLILSYDSLEPKNSKSEKNFNTLTGISINNHNNGTKNNLITLSNIPISPLKNKLLKLSNSKNSFTYSLKKNPKKIQPLNLEKYEKNFEECYKILNSRNLKNYSLPKIFSYQKKGTPRLIQNTFLKYTNEKRNIKNKIIRRNDYNEIKNQVISLRRNLYDPKKI